MANNHQIELRYDGATYEAQHDDVRLTGQLLRVYLSMNDGSWRTLAELSDKTGDPQASISAQLRHLRKKRFGSNTVNKRIRGERDTGLYEYQLLVNPLTEAQVEAALMVHSH